MKFHDLAIGQRFELDGAIYIKTSPVLASPEIAGSTRFMARYVAVRPLDGAERATGDTHQRMIRAEAVRAAFTTYHAQCRKALERLQGEIPAGRLEDLLATLEAAHKDFLGTL
jgi:hypothetical protein